MTHKDSANYSKGKLAVGYGVIVLLIGAIISLYQRVAADREIGSVQNIV